MTKSYNLKGKTLRVLMIACVALAVLAGGCICCVPSSGGGAATPTVKPVASPGSGNDGTPTPAPGATGGNVPDVSSIGENIVVKGTGNGDAKVNLKAGGYVAYSTARSALQLQELTSSGASNLYPDGLAPDKSGWLSCLKIIHVSESGEKTFRVTTGGNYEIRFNRLPSSDRQYMPWTSYGKGTSCTPPVEITGSDVKISVSCKDTLKGPFTAYLVDGSSGEYYDVILSTRDASVDVMKTVSIPKPGIYNVQIDAMISTDWKVQFSK